MSIPAAVRAKFRCLEVTKRYSHTESPSAHNDNAPEHDVFQYAVRLVPVYGKGKNGKGSESLENRSFYAATPTGQIELTTISESAAAAFVPGQAYYIDFTPADG